ncbi:MAG: glycosyltransferase N-terminal domain-containing protein [Rickettsiaceae bacterium]|nr:glycosyltransferase N-terminal domain-containing protein [Rickettsiaceae bacterium]
MQLVLILLSIVLLPIQFLIILFRILLGKEDPKRFLEKFSIIALPKTQNIIWIHAASVGESNIALNLVDELSDNKNKNFLITTGTIASGANVKKRIESHNNIFHQYVPIDNFFVIQKFLAHWKPVIFILIESEIWPITILASSKQMNLVLVNGIMSDRSFHRWLKFKFLIEYIGKKFAYTLVQTPKDFNYFKKLGFNNVATLGNLKYTQKKLPINVKLFNNLINSIETSKSIFAVSTHKADEEHILTAFANLLKLDSKLKIIIAPRHIERLEELKSLCKDKQIQYRLRSAQQDNIIDSDWNIFILDTIGEVNSIFSLGLPTFVGGSFEDGGHNIIEPALYGCPIMFGPDMSNFEEIKNDFMKNNAAIQVASHKDLEKVFKSVISSSASEKLVLINNAYNIIKEKQNILALYKEKIQDLL